MSNTYNINFSDFRQQPDFEEMFVALESSFKLYDIDFYLVGAIAKNIWINAIHEKPPTRATKGFDMAVLISTKEVFQTLKQHLTTNYPFAGSSQNAFTLIWKEKFAVDLLPFGEIEDEDAKVIVDGSGLVNISVPGFSEVYQNDLRSVLVENETSFKICSLIGIIILKLFAWNDRPEVREKDITDIGEIMYHYFYMHDEFIYENYAHLFDEHNDLNQLAAVVIGSEIKKVLGTNKLLLKKIIDIIEADIAKNEQAILSVILAKQFENTIDENTTLLSKILAGLK
jgi:predicted nucleotidyltransferase